MKKLTINAYQFDELSKEARQKALEKFRDINTEFNDWSDSTEEHWQELLKEQGYEDPKIFFSGFGSQGDGACFTCSAIDLNKFQAGKYKELANVLSVEITHTYRYFYAASTNVIVSELDNCAQEDFDELEKAVEAERIRLGNEIYSELEKDYFYQISDEAIKETIEANEYLFSANGELLPIVTHYRNGKIEKTTFNGEDCQIN